VRKHRRMARLGAPGRDSLGLYKWSDTRFGFLKQFYCHGSAGGLRSGPAYRSLTG